MSPIRLVTALAAVCACAATPDASSLLKQVEKRYNQAQSLEVQFHEAYTAPNRPRRTESGTLVLRKPGRMRWDYTSPAGKLFVGDGKYLWLYVPSTNRVEKMKMKESEDMRAPLAFLLGKLHFDKEFRNVTMRPDAGGTLVEAEPKADNLPWSHVEFLVSPAFEIRRVKVVGFDNSILEFEFTGEKLNPSVNAAAFRFEVPQGAELVEGAQ